MSVFTGKMLKQARQNANLSQEDVVEDLNLNITC